MKHISSGSYILSKPIAKAGWEAAGASRGGIMARKRDWRAWTGKWNSIEWFESNTEILCLILYFTKLISGVPYGMDMSFKQKATQRSSWPLSSTPLLQTHTYRSISISRRERI
jgi:hypothetical protein